LKRALAVVVVVVVVLFIYRLGLHVSRHENGQVLAIYIVVT